MSLTRHHVDRREFLRLTVHGASGLILIPSAAAFLAACQAVEEASRSASAPAAAPSASGAATSAAASPAAIETSDLLVGASAAPSPASFLLAAGPIVFGSEFGLTDVTYERNFREFDSNATVAQASLSGQLSFHSGSTMGHLALIDQGQPFKIFAPYANATDYVLVGRGDIDSFDDLLRTDITVGSDDLGGLGHAIFDAILISGDAGFLVTDIPNLQILGSSGGRATAMAAGQMNATLLHLPQARQVEEELGEELNYLGSEYDSAGNFVGSSAVARTEWLDENTDLAAAIVASIIRASRVFKEDYDAFRDAVESLVPEPPPDESTREVWDLASQSSNFWPTDGGLREEAIEFMVDLGKREDLLTGDLPYEDIVDPRPRDRALELVGPEA